MDVLLNYIYLFGIFLRLWRFVTVDYYYWGLSWNLQIKEFSGAGTSSITIIDGANLYLWKMYSQTNNERGEVWKDKNQGYTIYIRQNSRFFLSLLRAKWKKTWVSNIRLDLKSNTQNALLKSLGRHKNTFHAFKIFFKSTTRKEDG